MVDKSKLDAIADAVGKLSSRFDGMVSKKDEWSEEAREAAAKSRKSGMTGKNINNRETSARGGPPPSTKKREGESREAWGERMKRLHE